MAKRKIRVRVKGTIRVRNRWRDVAREGCDCIPLGVLLVENKAKISASGQTCGRNEKTGTFYPIEREECACNQYHENARFQEI